MKVHIQALHNISKHVDVNDFRLFPVPVGEFFHLVQELRFVQGTGLTGTQRVVDGVDTGKIIRGEIGCTAEFDTVIEIFDELVIHLVGRNGERQ